MSAITKIQWTDATWNIAVGCTKVNSDCKYCYMYRGSLDGKRYDPVVVRKTKSVFRLPLKLKTPSLIFTSSLTDVFHPACDSFRDEMWEIIKKCPHHTFQILTKRPERIRKCLPEDWGSGYPNVWLGVSAGHQNAYDEMVNVLLHVPAVCRFVSIEPLTEQVDLKDGSYGNMLTDPLTGVGDFHVTPKLDWVIIGGESGNNNGKYKYRPCDITWIKKAVKQCKEARVPVFVKQLGTHLSEELHLTDRHGGDINEFPKELRVRQFPKIYKRKKKKHASA